jgi:hypothetical protein
MIDEICRTGAQRMLLAALEAEVDAYVEAFAGEVDVEENGKRLVVRNDYARPKTVTTECGHLRRGGSRRRTDLDPRSTPPRYGKSLVRPLSGSMTNSEPTASYSRLGRFSRSWRTLRWAFGVFDHHVEEYLDRARLRMAA